MRKCQKSRKRGYRDVTETRQPVIRLKTGSGKSEKVKEFGFANLVDALEIHVSYASLSPWR